MSKYEISVDFGNQGFTINGNIFAVIKAIKRHSNGAKVTVRRTK